MGAVVRAEIASIRGVHDTESVLFEVAFTEPAPTANGRQFQLFIDEDGNELTGYWKGFDKLVRGVDIDDSGLAFIRSTSGGSGPGGWGSATSVNPNVRVANIDEQHLEFEVPLGASGIALGAFRFTLEVYLDERVSDTVLLQETVSGATVEDDDADGVEDAEDNCPKSSNADQSDADGDGAGDVCDPCPLDDPDDSDGDGICDVDDNCLERSNVDQSDTDGDGAGDVCDPCPLDDPDDSDGDGICDSAEVSTNDNDEPPGDDQDMENDNAPPDDGSDAPISGGQGQGLGPRGPSICGSCGAGVVGATLQILIGLFGLRFMGRHPRRS